MTTPADKDYVDAKDAAILAGVEGRVDTYRADLGGRIDTHLATMNTRFAEAEANFSTRFAEAEANFSTRFAAMDAKIETLGADLRREMAENTTRIVQWTIGTFIATIAIFITVVTFVLNNAIPKAVVPSPVPPPTAAAPAVVIMVSPQGATVLPATPPSP